MSKDELPSMTDSELGALIDVVAERVIVSESLVARIAEAAADKAVAKITTDAYVAVGRTVVEKAFWVIGLAAVALFLYGVRSGWIKLP